MDSCPITYIYGLEDPFTHEIKYVGKSDKPRTRFISHKYPESYSTKKGWWIFTLRIRGKKPILKILACVPRENWRESEREWINKFRDTLVNSDNSYLYRPKEFSQIILNARWQILFGRIGIFPRRKTLWRHQTTQRHFLRRKRKGPLPVR